ncbi:hypothetical protein AGMMS50293_20210 [Spirochaetia bacterium]|nr:hypothetical protein AGMMS50293_20210 [Spirochaetia bacterium]
MSFNRFLIALILISLLAGALLLALGSLLNPAGYSGGYAVLITDAAIPDKTLAELLAGADRYFAAPPVSESSQWVALDEFGSLARIPLDGYSERLGSFDPRNDGYAEKLRSFFVRDGKRYVFIPLRPGVSAAFEKRLAVLLGDIHFTLDFLGFGKPLRFYFILFAVAVLGLFIVRYAQKRFRSGGAFVNAVCLVPGIPALAALAYYGAAGFALAAVLLGLAALLREPLFELGPLLRFASSGAEEKRSRFFRNVYEPFRLHWFLLPAFLAFYALIGFLSKIPPWFAVAIFVIHTGINLFSIWTFSLPGGHIRFSPVLIMKRRAPDFGFSALMLPFALAALMAAILTPFLPGAGSAKTAAYREYLVSEAEYRDHLAFQAGFSLRPLGHSTAGEASSAAYPAYTLDTDGLISPAPQTAAGLAAVTESFPPFPLKPLMNFLGAVKSGATPGAANSAPTFMQEYLPVLFLVLFIIPGCILKGEIPVAALAKSRFSGKNRWGDKKRKKILLYSGDRNTRLVRKDA